MDVGHSASFRNYLEYWPTYKIYEKNMLEQKIDVKKIFKDEYKPTKEEKEFLK